ncbi:MULTISPECIES: LysR family transcriptional regulator [Paenibacillus]|uniref:LysR family transcriptional regulator n=1 Tax=Paenibacillus albilobatus TaxID=2716884 RepID=A0A919XB85_9BACL|nr:MULTISPECIES: LysR family transcriptional regulator [Paenibacillus]GIO29447.1 LysR family transcriptional regulator [Paenibacillus albilobatus]
MDLTYLHTFREVALRQSFTRAAEELGYAQSSVTTQIQKLEKAYDVQLFERFGKGLRLTSAGEELLRFAVQMLDLYQQSKERLGNQSGGTLSIGTIDSLAAYFLPPYLQELRERYEGLSVRLQTGREAHILKQVKDGELDLGLILDDEPSDPTLAWQTIRDEPLVLLASPGHPLCRKKKIALEHLAGAEWIMPEESCNYRIMLEKALKQSGTPYVIGLELGNPEAIKRCVMSGSGISLLPRMAAAAEIGRGELVSLPFAHPGLRLTLLLAMHLKKWISNPLRELVDRIRHAAD